MWGADTGAAYCLWDSSNDALWLDSADIALGQTDYILFGDTMGTGDFSLGTTANNVLSFSQIVAGTGSVLWGVNGAGLDNTWYGDTASANFMWDTDVDQLVFAGATEITLNDDVEILFGTGASNAGDFSILGSGTGPVLKIDVISAGSGSIEIGNDADDVPFKWWGETTGNYILMTGDQLQIEGAATGAQLALGDGDAILFGDALGTGAFTLSSTSDVLTLAQVSADTGTIVIGVTGGTDIPITWYGETSGADLILTGDTILIDGIDMTFEDGDFLKFGDGSDFTMTSASAANFTVNGAASDETDTFNFGADGDGLLVLFHSATGSDLITWDAANEALEFVGVDLVMDTDSVATLTTIKQSAVIIPTAGAAYDVLASNSGKLHIIGEMANNTTMDLPPEAAGLYYRFVYISSADPPIDETHDHNIDSESNTNFFRGGVSFIDTDAGAGADELHAGVYSDGDSNSIFTINNMSAGTSFEIWCDGTNWYITGIIIADTTPSFGDQ